MPLYYPIAMLPEQKRQIIRIVVEGAVESLQINRELINSLNLFPVPDGDTGTNMYLTLAGGLREMEKTPDSSVVKALQDLAQGSLQDSKGNSGVILAQLLEGISTGLSKCETPGIGGLFDGFRIGAKLVYSAVQNPVEGTILTVIREMANELDNYSDAGMGEFLSQAYSFACDSLLRNRGLLDKFTPGEITPVDTIDAGGAGLVIAFEGALSSVGIPLEKLNWSEFVPRYRLSEYCGPNWELMFVLDCSGDKLGALKSELGNHGDSIVLAGSTPPYTIHIHTNDPEEVLNAVSAFGSISGIEVSEMLAGIQVSREELPREFRKTTVIAYAGGTQLQTAFREMGADVLESGPDNQAEIDYLSDKISRSNSSQVILLPNYPHLLNSANEAERLFSEKVNMIPTESPIQGLAAMEEYFDNGNPREIFNNMRKAASAVNTGSLEIKEDPGTKQEENVPPEKFSGKVGDSLVFEDSDLTKAVLGVCESLRGKSSGSVLTLIAGKNLSEADRSEISTRVSELMPEFDQEWYEDNSSGWLLQVGLE